MDILYIIGLSLSLVLSIFAIVMAFVNIKNDRKIREDFRKTAAEITSITALIKAEEKVGEANYQALKDRIEREKEAFNDQINWIKNELHMDEFGEWKNSKFDLQVKSEMTKPNFLDFLCYYKSKKM